VQRGGCCISPLHDARASAPARAAATAASAGISLLSSYQGAQIFEAIGVGGDLLNLGFRGTPSRLGGITTANLASETALFVEAALTVEEKAKLVNYGYVQFYR
jgi:glutamate synthase (ferredoxin)